MKTNHIVLVISAATVLGTLGGTGWAALPDAPVVAATNSAQPITIQVVSTAVPDVGAPTQWSEIKDLTYDTRARFFAGLKQLETRVDAQMSELTAKRAAMTSAANTKDWDFAMKEMIDARLYLKSTGEVLAKAMPETWNQEKDKVGQAWVRTQEAYAKVKSSTTS